jgi:hypothetical protein
MASSRPDALRRGAFLAAAVAFATLGAAREAEAFCRTSTCSQGTGALCTPPQEGDCGKAIAWPSECISFSVQQDGSPKSGISTSEAESVFGKAFLTWGNADCGDGGPNIRVLNLGPVACAEHEFNQEENLGNANIIIFRDSGWPHGGGNNVLALTTVTYDLDTGDIYDADMELNSEATTFSTGDTNVGFDLQSIATHEAGHFLGLSHTPDKNATMFADYIPGTTALRDLEEDDRAGICAIYPHAGVISPNCDPAPVHGLATECNSPPGATACCTVAPGAPAEHGGAVLGIALGLLALAARRRVG